MYPMGKFFLFTNIRSYAIISPEGGDTMQTVREQILWYISRIRDERALKRILAFVARLFLAGGGRGG
jgi:hypothetical protein